MLIESGAGRRDNAEAVPDHLEREPSTWLKTETRKSGAGIERDADESMISMEAELPGAIAEWLFHQGVTERGSAVSKAIYGIPAAV